MELQQVPATHIDQAWKDGAHKLSEACKESGGEVTADQLKMMLARGERTLFAGMNGGLVVGWLVVRVDQLPNVRVLHLCELFAPNAMVGEFFDQLKAMAGKLGCSEIRCAAKPAQSRLYQMKFRFEPVYEILRFEV